MKTKIGGANLAYLFALSQFFAAGSWRSYVVSGRDKGGGGTAREFKR
jgi:hypothetical protein